MDFSNFAHILYPLLNEKESTGEFAMKLFSNIVTDDGEQFLDNISKNTFRAYYSGSCGITKIAKKLSPYLDTESFASYLSECSDETTEVLRNTFLAKIPDITSFDSSKLIAEFFRDIIVEAAKGKRKPSNRKSKKSDNTSAAHAIDDEHKKTANDNESPNSTENKNITVIQNQTNIVQNGFNITNTGTINFNF